MTISALNGHHDVVCHLIAYDADVNKKNVYGLTALHIASERGNLEIVKSLLNAGAKIDEVDGSLSTPLMLAAFEGHQDIVNHLITCGASVDKKGLNNQTALHYASKRGNLEMVKSLLNAGAKIDEVEYRSLFTPLMLAAFEGHQDIVNHLITCGASVDKKGLNNQTTLHYESERGNLETVKLLLNAGAKIDEVNGSKYTPLMLAACEGHQDIVRHLIACGASVDKKGPNNRTALHCASERGNLGMVKLLLNAGAKIDEVDGSRSTPLMLAACESHKDIVTYMIACGGSVDRKGLDNRTALHHASERGNLEMVKSLLNAGAKIDEVDYRSLSTPLMLAAHEGHQDIVGYLITCGAIVDGKGLHNRTALHYASERGNLEIVKLLLNAGAKIDEVDGSRSTPLMLAACESHKDVVTYMIACGASVDKKGLDNRTALHYASERGNLEMVKSLLNAGAKIDEVDGSLSTPLMLAAHEGHQDIVGYLITCGAIVDRKGLNDQTALHYASERGNLEMVKLLLNAGAEIDEVDRSGSTPLMLAMYINHAAIISYLLNATKQDVSRQTVLYILASHLPSGSTLHKVDITKPTERLHPKNQLGREVFSYAINQKYEHAAKVLITNGVGIEGLLSTSPPMAALMWTAQEGDDSLTKQLILQGVNINYQNPDGRAALHFAAHSGRLEIVKILLNNRAEIDIEDKHHHTPLVLSIEAKKYDVMLHLITSGADVIQLAEHLDKDLGREALSYAINSKNVEVANVLTAKGFGIEGLLSTSPPMTALMWTAQEGYDSLTKQLILRGVNVNYHNPDGCTALQFAARSGRLEVVQILLNSGAEVDLEDKHHHTPLVLSVEAKKYDVMLHLIVSGADVTQLAEHLDRDLGREALSYAINSKNVEVANVLTAKGFGIEGLLSTSPPMTALMWTAQKGYNSLTKQLIFQGVNVNYQNPDGRAALHFAACSGRLEVVQMLLNSGAEIDPGDEHHHTPLVLSVEAKKYDVMLHLITSGADVTQLAKHTNKDLGKEALSYTINNKQIDVVVASVLIINGVGIEGLLSTSPPMTALMWTAQEGYDSLTRQLILQGVNINYRNSDGRTALHYAAHTGHLHIVQVLLNNGAEIDPGDEHHHTPLVLSVVAKNYDVMLHLITSGADVAQLGECTYSTRDLGREALSYAINSKHKDIADIFIASGVGIKGLLSTSPPMTVLMWTAKEGDDSSTKQLILQGVNINYQNPGGRTALHFAAHSDRLNIIKILLNNGAEIDLEDKHHHTPLVLSVEAKKYDVMLHLITSGADVTQLAQCTYSMKNHREALSYAVNHKHKDVAKGLITKGVGIERLLSTSPPMTALMWTAQEGYDSLTKELILQGVNINYQNPDGCTALHFVSRHNHIQCGILLVEAGADVSTVNKASLTPLDLSSNEFKDAILQTLSFQTKKTVCVIGNAMSGKSTLIASLKNENAWFWTRFRNRLFGVQDISERTAGIEPVSLNSKRYGDVMFFDFAGQHEYHGPHEMFLESILIKGLSTVTIIVVVKATEDESAICHQLNRWLHPFVKMSSSTNPVRVIVIGSHMDEVKRKVEAKEKLELCYETVKDSLRDVPVKFEDLCYLDCRQPYSSDISKLCKYLKDVPPPQYKAVHIGYSIPWVITRIRSSIDEKVISVAEFSDWIAHNQANLPTNLPPAEEVCKDLSSTGHFLYLPSKEGISNGWLVLDLPSILHEVYGTLFSPSKKIVNKFGLLNCQRLSVLFPTLDSSMIRDVLISLEFCIEVDPSILSGSIHLMDSSDEGHEHLFFPALVSTEPPIVFNEECKGNHLLCWQLEVRENSFLSPRLLQTIILRLATHHVFHYKRGFKTREHYCSVWWNGIFWRSTKDADVAVQISDSAVVQVIGRSAVSPEGLCMYMSRVIQDIFATICTLSPHLSGTEYMIHPVNPQDLLKNPLKSPPPQMFPVEFILESRRNGGSRCLSCNAVDKIAEEKAVSDVFGGFEPSVDVIERFSMSACECVLVYVCPCILVYMGGFTNVHACAHICILVMCVCVYVHVYKCVHACIELHRIAVE